MKALISWASEILLADALQSINLEEIVKTALHQIFGLRNVHNVNLMSYAEQLPHLYVQTSEMKHPQPCAIRENVNENRIAGLCKFVADRAAGLRADDLRGGAVPPAAEVTAESRSIYFGAQSGDGIVFE